MKHTHTRTHPSAEVTWVPSADSAVFRQNSPFSLWMNTNCKEHRGSAFPAEIRGDAATKSRVINPVRRRQGGSFKRDRRKSGNEF